MDTLVTVYWVCFGVGLVYVLLAGAMGAISHGFAGAHAGDSGGIDLDHEAAVELGDAHTGAEAGHFDAHAGGLESQDLAGDGHHDAPAGHALELATDSGMPDYNPFSLLSIMGMLAGFGAGGLIASYYGLELLAGLGAAASGALVMALALWLLIGKLLYSLHSSSEAHVADMIGLEAEVLTPVEPGISGEIAYILDGTRYTAPARLVHDGLAGRSEKVRIRKVGDNLVYVEQKRKLLS